MVLKEVLLDDVGGCGTAKWMGGASRAALTCAALAFGFLPQIALAQETSEPTQTTTAEPVASESEDAIVVTGVRAGILKSLETKRNSDSIVDVISSEDIGKFPDNNIAEAVQRIPGVSIDRSGGEGRRISINGLGPEFSMTLLNGREIASADTGRAFSFDTIASDLVGSINVYKTATAAVPEGGLGGTIDLRTARPFDFSGMRASASLEYLYEDNSKSGDLQASAFFSNRFMDDRLGVLLSFSHQKRHGRNYFATGGQWTRNYFVDPVEQAYVEDDQDEAWRSWNVQYGTTDSYRERNGGTASIQFEASDKLTLTADYLYSKFNVKEVVNSGGAYLWAVQDSPESIMDENGVYTQLDVSGGHSLGSFSINKNVTYRPTTTQVAGLNAKWSPSDRLTANIDLSWSKAVTNNRGRNTSQALEMLNQPGYLVVFPEDGSTPSFDLKGVDLSKRADQFRARIVGNSGTYTKAENKGAKFDLGYEFSSAFNVKAGVSYSDIRKLNENYSTPSLVTRMYHKFAEGQPIDTNSIILGTINANSRFGINGSSFPIFVMDEDALRAWMANPANIANRTVNDAASRNAFIANGNSWDAVRNANSYDIQEKDLSAYTDLHFDLDLGSVPLQIVAGMRYSKTNLSSNGTMRILTGFDAQPNSLVPLYNDAAATAISVKNSYDEWLPSLNMKFELQQNMFLRLAATKTMTRPTLTNLAPAITIGGSNYNRRNASGSNPLLKPFTSVNFDASWEWYYSKSGAIAIAGFYKKAKDFIVSIAADEIIDTVSVSPEVQAKYPDVNFQLFRVTRPRNAEEATVKGITFAWTHALDMGLGFQANYTLVRSSATLPKDGSFAIPGISDTANVVLFYEKGPISARVAFNWRDRFLVTVGNDDAHPIYNDPYHQFDARLGYDIGHGITLGLEATNITNEKVKSHGLYSNEFVSFYNQGRQFRGTVSKKF